MTGGMGLSAAAERAVRFTERCTLDTYNNGGERLYGVQFEPRLGELTQQARL